MMPIANVSGYIGTGLHDKRSRVRQPSATFIAQHFGDVASHIFYAMLHIVHEQESLEPIEIPTWMEAQAAQLISARHSLSKAMKGGSIVMAKVMNKPYPFPTRTLEIALHAIYSGLDALSNVPIIFIRHEILIRYDIASIVRVTLANEISRQRSLLETLLKCTENATLNAILDHDTIHQLMKRCLELSGGSVHKLQLQAIHDSFLRATGARRRSPQPSKIAVPLPTMSNPSSNSSNWNSLLVHSSALGILKPGVLSYYNANPDTSVSSSMGDLHSKRA